MEKDLIKKNLLGAIKFFLFASLFTPLILGQFGLNFSEYPKAVFFRSLVEIAFLLFIFLLLLDKKYIPKSSILVLSVALFLAILIVSGAFGINFYRSFFGDLSRGEGTIMHVHLFLFFIMLISVFKEKKDWLNLFKVYVIVSGISSFCAVLQLLNVNNFYAMAPGIASGTLSNQDLFAYFNVLSIFLAIFILILEEKKYWKYIIGCILALDFLTLLETGSRGALAGLIAGMVIFIIYCYLRLEYKKRMQLLFVILILSVLALLAFSYPDFFHLTGTNFFAKISGAFQGGLGDRKDLWDIALRAFESKPILGWGPENFSFVFDKYFKQGYPGLGSDETAIYFDRPHNKFWEVAVSSGVMGLLSYFLVFGVLFYLIFKHFKSQKNIRNNERLISILLFSFFIAYFVQNFFAFDNIATYIAFFLMAGYINNNFAAPGKALGAEQPKAPKNSKWGKYIPSFKIAFAVLAAVLITIFFYQLNVKPTLAGMSFAGSVQYEGLHPDVALKGYKEGISQNTLYDKDLRITFIDRMIFLLENGAAKPIQQDVINSLLQLRPILYGYLDQPDQNAKFLYGDAFYLNEHAYLFYKDKSYLGEMEKVAEKAINFNPAFPTFYQFMGETKILQGDDRAGEDYMKKSYDIIKIKKADDEFKYLYETGAVYLKMGEMKKATDKFQQALDVDIKYKEETGQSVSLINPGSFIDALAITLANSGDLKACKNVYEEGIQAYPEYAGVFQSHLDTLIQQSKQK